MRWWPRSIRWQMLLGLVLLEALSITLFALLLFRFQQHDVYSRATERIGHQVTSLASQAQEGIQQNRPDWVGLSVHILGQAPSVSLARLTDPAGQTLYVSKGEPYLYPLEPEEMAQIAQVHGR